MSQTVVNVIGAGRVGQTFIHLLRSRREYLIQDVLSGHYSSAQKVVDQVGAGRAVKHMSDLRPADIWIIAVPDTVIEPVASDLAKALLATAASPSTAFHCSGFYSAEVLAPLRQLGWTLASVHPVLSFADPDKAKDQFNGTLCGLEGDDSALSVLLPMLQHLGAECFSIRSDGKSLYHAAAVISNNFAVVLQAIAREAWAEAGVTEDVARKLNAKLLESTAENVNSLGPQNALTGPAARGDEMVVISQGEDVARWHPEAGEVYRCLSTLARSLKQTGTTKSNGA